jgi:hypothetical protein
MEGAEVPIFSKVDTFKPVREFILTLEPPLDQHNIHSAIEDTPVSNLGEHSNVISSRLNVRRLLRLPTVLHHATTIDMNIVFDNEFSTGGLGSIPTAAMDTLGNPKPLAMDLNAENRASQGWCPSERAKTWRRGTGFLDT